MTALLKVAFAGWLTLMLGIFVFDEDDFLFPERPWYANVAVAGVVAAALELAFGLFVFLWVWALY